MATKGLAVEVWLSKILATFRVNISATPLYIHVRQINIEKFGISLSILLLLFTTVFAITFILNGWRILNVRDPGGFDNLIYII